MLFQLQWGLLHPRTEQAERLVNAGSRNDGCLSYDGGAKEGKGITAHEVRPQADGVVGVREQEMRIGEEGCGLHLGRCIFLGVIVEEMQLD